MSDENKNLNFESEKFGVVFIYTLSDPRDGKIRYVGKTNDLKHRLRGHINEAMIGRNSHKCSWIKALKFQGMEPLIEPIEILHFATDVEIRECESFWINNLRFLGFNLTNLIEGGIGGVMRHSEESREKFRKSRTGRKMPLETRLKISAAMKGKRRSPESYKKQAEERKGKKLFGKSLENVRNAMRSKTKEQKENAANAVRAFWKSEKSQANRIKLSESANKMWSDPEFRIKISKAAKAMWSDPEHRLRYSAKRKGVPWSEARRNSQIEK